MKWLTSFLTVKESNSPGMVKKDIGLRPSEEFLGEKSSMFEPFAVRRVAVAASPMVKTEKAFSRSPLLLKSKFAYSRKVNSQFKIMTNL